MLTSGNLFADMPSAVSAEQITALLSTPNLKIERIVSHGQTSPEGFWYDQPQDEWVLLLKGEATLEIDDQPALPLLLQGAWAVGGCTAAELTAGGSRGRCPQRLPAGAGA